MRLTRSFEHLKGFLDEIKNGKVLDEEEGVNQGSLLFFSSSLENAFLDGWTLDKEDSSNSRL